MKSVLSKVRLIFLSVILWIVLSTFFAVLCTVIYYYCYNFSPNITEASNTFFAYLVYSCINTFLIMELLNCYYYSEKQIGELKKIINKQLEMINHGTK